MALYMHARPVSQLFSAYGRAVGATLPPDESCGDMATRFSKEKNSNMTRAVAATSTYCSPLLNLSLYPSSSFALTLMLVFQRFVHEPLNGIG